MSWLRLSMRVARCLASMHSWHGTHGTSAVRCGENLFLTAAAAFWTVPTAPATGLTTV